MPLEVGLKTLPFSGFFFSLCFLLEVQYVSYQLPALLAKSLVCHHGL